MQIFTPQDVNWWTGVVWITWGLLWCFYQLFGLSFWRHPFTAEDPLVSKWCKVPLNLFWWRNQLTSFKSLKFCGATNRSLRRLPLVCNICANPLHDWIRCGHIAFNWISKREFFILRVRCYQRTTVIKKGFLLSAHGNEEKTRSCFLSSLVSHQRDWLCGLVYVWFVCVIFM